MVGTLRFAHPTDCARFYPSRLAQKGEHLRMTAEFFATHAQARSVFAFTS
jgi:hypothetical protein